jgi:hypothetical protein
MRLAARGWLSLAAALLVTSCAVVWGFDDATLARDGGMQAAPDVPDATDAGGSAAPDAAVDQGVPAATCSPPCGPGAACERAVGDASVCVSAMQTCTDSADCFAPSCCVWLDHDSGVGRCQSSSAPGPAPGPMCLCTKKTSSMPGSFCRQCEAPPGDPSAPVLICGAL